MSIVGRHAAAAVSFFNHDTLTVTRRQGSLVGVRESFARCLPPGAGCLADKDEGAAAMVTASGRVRCGMGVRKRLGRDDTGAGPTVCVAAPGACSPCSLVLALGEEEQRWREG